jgi:mercuric ion binding protein
MNVLKTLLILTALGTAPIAAAETVEMTVNGLVCGFCAAGVEKTLRKNPATEDVVISLEHRLVAVAIKPGAEILDDALRKALEDSGYDVKAIVRTDRSIASIRQQVNAEG